MDNKELYRNFCGNQESIPVFSTDWWLDAVCGEDNWNVALVEKGGNIVASMPYYINPKRKKHLEMPPLTQTLGPFIVYPEKQKYTKRLSYEKKVMNQLIDQLPDFKFFHQRFSPEITNWLAFYWKNFQETTRYTYIIEDLKNTEVIWNGLKDNIRGDIRKAEKIVTVEKTDNLELFFKINQLTFNRQEQNIPHSYHLLQRLDKACEKHECRKMLVARDEQSRVHSAIYIVWDKRKVYYLLGGADPELRNSGASSLLLWEAIKFSSEFVSKFDFEGSMLKPVERFFSSFGAIQIPYFTIYKDKRSKIRKIASLLRN